MSISKRANVSLLEELGTHDMHSVWVIPLIAILDQASLFARTSSGKLVHVRVLIRINLGFSLLFMAVFA